MKTDINILLLIVLFLVAIDAAAFHTSADQ